MDNATLLYNAIQRSYRNAIVELIRTRMAEEYGQDGIAEVQRLFAKTDPSTGLTQWESLEAVARQRRSGGTGELSTPIRDEYELLGVEHFFNVFEKHFSVLCPKQAAKSKSELNQARQALITWMKQIKNVRDPVSHPVTDDISYDDSWNVLYCARKILDFCELPEAAKQILNSQAKLLGGFASKSSRILAILPPSDEVVMDFIGRHTELEFLQNWLAEGRSVRWALSGEGGKGKSAIAYAFAKAVAGADDHGLDAVVWMSAKRRRFIEGQIMLVDRPDFHDRRSAAEALVRAFGETPSESSDENESMALWLLTEWPSLIVVDDIDTVEAEGEDAIQFLLMAIPERSKSRVLITSRRAVFGMANLTTQVVGLSKTDGQDFLKSRCDLMGIPPEPILLLKDKILDITDSTPLYIEDLFRLIQSGLDVESALGLWADKRGLEARRYALQREYDQLDLDPKYVLLALAIEGPCKPDYICRGLNWDEDRLANALQQLQKLFLLPKRTADAGKTLLALNNNMRALVLDVFKETEAYRRTERTMRAASGELKTKKTENFKVDAGLRRARLLVNQWEIAQAEKIVTELINEFPGRSDCHANLAWLYKKKGDVADARINFRRAHELACRDLDAFWHWAEMEADEGEWRASADAAKLGLRLAPSEQGLLFRYGYALHREGKELFFEGDPDAAKKLCEKAQAVLEDALAQRNAEDRNFALRSQIYRALVLNSDILEDGQKVARFIAEWASQCPADPHREKELDKLRLKYPQYLQRH